MGDPQCKDNQGNVNDHGVHDLACGCMRLIIHEAVMGYTSEKYYLDLSIRKRGRITQPDGVKG